MVTKELSEAAVEMNVILERAPEEFIKKIPQKFREFLKKIESKTYKFDYDDSKNLNEQNLKKETRGLIGLIYRDYICDDEERNEYISKVNNYVEQLEIETRDQYNSDMIFKNKKIDLNKSEEIVSDNITDMTVYKESFIKKLWNKFISIFKRK